VAVKLSAQQQQTVRDVLAEADAYGASPMERLAAIETIAVEANYGNPNGGDRDSLGAFQQRASWGSAESRLNVRESARRFFDTARSMRQGTQFRHAGDLAAAVQRPAAAYRGRYQARRGEALKVLQQVGAGPAVPHGASAGGSLAADLNGDPSASAFDPSRGMTSLLEVTRPVAPAVTPPTPPAAAAQAQPTMPAAYPGAPQSGSPASLMPPPPAPDAQTPDYSASFGGTSPGAPAAGGGGGQSGRTILIGDSLGVGTSRYLKGVESDAKVGRSSSQALQLLGKAVQSGDVSRVLFDVGTNDGSAAELRKSIQRARGVAPDTELVMLTVHGPDAAAKNKLLRGLAAKGEITLVDWAAHSGGLVGGDGIHATAQGYRARAKLIEEALAAPPAGGGGGGGAAPQVRIARGANSAGKPIDSDLLGLLDEISSASGKPITVTTGTNHDRYVVGTNRVSDHASGNAVDIASRGRALTDGATDALLTVARGKTVQWLRNDGRVVNVRLTAANTRRLVEAGGIFNVPAGHGRRIQVIANTHQGGDHTNHYHIGYS
jgi:hypothetical protein